MYVAFKMEQNIRPTTDKGCFGVMFAGDIGLSIHEIKLKKNSPVWITVEPRHTFECAYSFSYLIYNKSIKVLCITNLNLYKYQLYCRSYIVLSYIKAVHPNLRRNTSYRFALGLRNKNAANDEFTVLPSSNVNLLQRVTL